MTQLEEFINEIEEKEKSEDMYYSLYQIPEYDLEEDEEYRNY